MTVYKVIHVVTMRDSWVAALWAVDVVGIVPRALMVRRAPNRVNVSDGQRVLIHMTLMHVVQMAIVQIIDMSVVLDSNMAAIRAMLVIMILVMRGGARCHEEAS